MLVQPKRGKPKGIINNGDEGGMLTAENDQWI